MAIAILNPRDYRTTDWSGGRTTELALYPASASYAGRDFLWRLSSATVECERSTFTSLPDYNRVLAVVDGGLILQMGGDGAVCVSLAPLQPYAFDGGAPIESVGRATDFNLMLRKGRCEGEVRCLAAGGPLPASLRLTLDPRYPLATHLAYAPRGAKLTLAGAAYALGAGQTLVCDLDLGCGMCAHDGNQLVVQQGAVLCASVYYGG